MTAYEWNGYEWKPRKDEEQISALHEIEREEPDAKQIEKTQEQKKAEQIGRIKIASKYPRTPRKKHERWCQSCGKEYTAYKATSKYCSVMCRMRAFRRGKK